MARDQKTRSKAFQAQKKAGSNQRVAPVATPVQAQAPQAIDNAQTTPEATDIASDEMQSVNNTTTTDTSAATDTTSISNETSSTTSVQQEQTAVQSSTASDQKVVWSGLQPDWPTWPTSKPGPRSKPPMPGTRSINKLRSEQFMEVGYNQQTGEPVAENPLRSLPDERTTGPTSFDLPTAQDVVGKRKQRL